MKRALIPLILAAVGLLASCGGSSNTSAISTATTSNPTPSPSATLSNIKHRAFVTDEFNHVIDIINADNDTANTTIGVNAAGVTTTAFTNTISVGTSPTIMVETADKGTTVVSDPGSGNLDIVDNGTESLLGTISLSNNSTESFVITPDSKTIYAAARNAFVGAGQPSGAVAQLDLTNIISGVPGVFPVASVHWVVLSHDGSKLLAFSDNSNTLTVINFTTQVITPVAGFDRPVWGIFTSDDSKAYILSCGPECGGKTAQVSILDTNALTITASIPVSAATMGLMDSSGNLYVAGTAVTGGKLDIVSTSSFTVTKSGIAISDGYHRLMAMGSNNLLFIGARTCSNTAVGCLSMYNTSSSAVAFSQPDGDITGLQPITGRNVVYVVEGGGLVIYDTTTAAPQATQIDIVGHAFDVRTVDN